MSRNWKLKPIEGFRFPRKGPPAPAPFLDLPRRPFAHEPVKDATRRSRGGSCVAILDSLFVSGLSLISRKGGNRPFPAFH